MMDILEIIGQIEELKGKQDFEGARKLTESSIGKYADDYRLYEELADIHLYEGNITGAHHAIDYGLELFPESATGNYLKGFLLLSDNKLGEALHFFKKSNELSGNNAEVLRNLGWTYTMLGEAEKGIFILRRALKLAPTDELIIEDLAMALIGIGDISKGNRLLKKIGKTRKLLSE